MPQPDQEDFFDTLHEWSERKLKLLKNYVEAADKILGSINQIYYVDGFAGRGTYRDGGIGSPIRIAELAQQYEREGKSYSFKCINVEENAEYFANLQKETAKFGSLVQNLHGRFADNLDQILRVIGNQPAIFFLDPFGIKGIDWSAVRKIINRKAKTDLWIRFDHIELRRLDGNYEVWWSQQSSQFLGQNKTKHNHSRRSVLSACIDLRWRLIVQRLMKPLVIVKREVRSQVAHRLCHALVIFDIYLLIFDTAP